MGPTLVFRHRVYPLLLAAAVLAAGLLVWQPARAIGSWVEAEPAEMLLSARDRIWYRQAFRAADKGAWSSALRLAGNARDRLPEKALRWAYYKLSGNHGTFEELAAFLRENPHWPAMQRVRRRAEEAMGRKLDDAVVLAWFEAHPPVSGLGRVRLAEALERRGDTAVARRWLYEAWIGSTFTKRQARAIYKRHKKHFTSRQHMARLDRLLWDGHRYSARRMLSLVPRDYQRLAQARLSLMSFGAGVDAKIAAVPRKLQDDPGLIYERVRWRRRKGLDSRAQDLLLAPLPEVMPRADKWWIERRIQVRKLMARGRHDDAYKLAAGHGLAPAGQDYAQAEWLAGWLSLQARKDPKTGYRHFRALYDAVRFPVSLSRAAYWAGRAAETAADPALAKRWYDVALNYPATYCGQLALARTGASERWQIPADAEADAADVERFDERELVRLVRMLHEVGAADWIKPFIMHLAETAASPAEHALTTQLAGDLGRPELMVRAGKSALRQGIPVYSRAYPVFELEPRGVDPALVLAVTRQESEFNPKAVSPAGARGLMQLMPATARKVAKAEGLRYHQRRLTDPGYNLRLGSAYLAELIEDYDGSYVMALAAYNAGPARVRRWVRNFGDPRDADVDVIDWVESIPLTETRNYVQRVMENLQVYRARLADGPTDVALLRDLRRNGSAY